MLKEIELVLLPVEASDHSVILQKAASALKLAQSTISDVKILKRSIDARGKQVVYRIKASVYINRDSSCSKRVIHRHRFFRK